MSIDLSTQYLGLELKNPVVVSSCPLTRELDSLRRLEDAGAAAVVMPSLFEEQVEHDEMAVYRFYEQGAESSAEAQSFFPELESETSGPDTYLRHIEEAKAALKIPVIGSLNGTSTGGWVRYGRLIQEAGADALELNVYDVVTDPNLTAQNVEDRVIHLLEAVGAVVTIPIAVKLSPFYSSIPNMAARLVEAGASGLVLFNRFLQPDIDLETLRVTPNLILSDSHELRLPLRWIAILRGHIRASLAATSGMHTAADALKLLLVGADVTMTASSLLKHGPGHIRTILDGIVEWMTAREYESVSQLKGSVSQINAPDPAAFERANYIKTLVNFTGVEMH